MYLFRLIEIFQMILHSLFSKNVKFIKVGLSECAEKHVFGFFYLNNLEKHRISFGTLGIHTKKMNSLSAARGAQSQYHVLP